MKPYILDVPLVVVYNYLENFREFLSRTGGLDALMDRRFNGDQALFWFGEKKLVISSSSIENDDLLKKRWGYQETILQYPDEPSAELSLDIVNSQRLRKEIVSYAGDGKKIAMIAYAATPEFYELVDTLEKEEGLIIELPESPRRKDLWVKRYIDTKLGFRILVADWLSAESPLPKAFVTVDLSQVEAMACWFAAEQNSGCVVKADQGGSGVGNLFLQYEQLVNVSDFSTLLSENEFLNEGVFVVEELIPSKDQVSPSIEFYVPPGNEAPEITYLCNQHFEASGRFAGVVIGQELYAAPWYPAFGEMGLKVANKLQALGYVGHFDMDAILDDEGRVYLVEINSRRTGGTYAHEFMQTRFGVNYANKMTMLSQNKVKSKYRDLSSLEAAIDDLLFPIEEQDKGVIIMLTSTLFKGNFGFIVLGDSIDEVVHLREQLMARI